MPPETLQDKVIFIFNNLSIANMDVQVSVPDVTRRVTSRLTTVLSCTCTYTITAHDSLSVFGARFALCLVR